MPQASRYARRAATRIRIRRAQDRSVRPANSGGPAKLPRWCEGLTRPFAGPRGLGGCAWGQVTGPMERSTEALFRACYGTRIGVGRVLPEVILPCNSTTA